MDWIQQWQSKLNKQNGVAPLVRTGGSRHTGLAALPYRNIQLGESTVEIRNAIEIIKFILGFIPVINCITDIYQLVDDVTQADEAKQIATGAAKDVIKKVTEGAANNVMDEYVATPENAGMPNAVKRESRDNLILSY